MVIVALQCAILQFVKDEGNLRLDSVSCCIGVHVFVIVTTVNNICSRGEIRAGQVPGDDGPGK